MAGLRLRLRPGPTPSTMHAPPGLDVWTAVPESQRLVLSNPLWNTGLRLQVPMVDAQPILKEIARLLEECRLEAVLVGNAAAALQGAPVTTLDFDFMFRRAPANIRKLKTLADKLGGRILRPYYPASGLYRLVVEDRGLQLDFMSSLHGIRSFEGLRSRAARTDFGGSTLLVADLRDIIRSKKALGRPRDLAVLEILEATLDEKEKKR